jgi:hypothetical protein
MKMQRVELKSLSEGLAFVAGHGGPVGEFNAWEIDGYMPPQGAYDSAGSYVLLADGSVFGVESYNNGPLSEVTPDEDFGVTILGFVPEGIEP